MPCSLILSVFPPAPVTQNALLSANISCQFTQHIKVASWVKGGGCGGGGWGMGGHCQQSKNAEEFMKKKEKILYYFRSVNCKNVSFMVVIVSRCLNVYI